MRTLLLALALGLAPAAHAQFSTTEGFQIGASFYGNTLNIAYDDDIIDEDADYGGGGIGLRAGYGFNRLFTLYLDFGGGQVALDDCDDDCDVNFGYGEIGGEFSFGGPAQRWVPFVNVGLSGVTLSSNEGVDTEIRGGGLKLGGGVSYFATPQLGIRASLNLAGGGINEVEIGGDSEEVEDTTYGLGRINLGVTYRF
jgi:hypothetical protein